MKKLLVAFCALVAVICCAFGFSACETVEVEGNTFVYDSAEVTFDDGVSQEIKDEYTVEKIDLLYANKTIIFNSDGTVSGTFFGEGEIKYSKNGKEYSLLLDSETKGVVVADKNGIALTASNDGINVKVKFKLSENREEGKEEEDSGIEGTYEFYSLMQTSTDPAFLPSTLYVGDKFQGTLLTENYIGFTLKADGKIEMKYIDGEPWEELPEAERGFISWEKTDDGYNLVLNEKADGSGEKFSFNMEYIDGKLTLKSPDIEDGDYVENSIMTLKKVK